MFWIPAATAITIMTLNLLIRIWRCKRQGIRIWDNIFQSKSAFAAYFILRFFVLVSLVRSLYFQNYQHIFLCLLSLLLFAVPVFLERSLKIKLPATLEVIVFCFIFAAEILGEINNFYDNIPGWDTMLHTINGFLCAAVGFAIVDLWNRSERTSLRLSPGYLALMAFCFSMTIGVLWEFFEFGMDMCFATDMQKDYIVTDISSTLLDPLRGGVPMVVTDIISTTIQSSDGATVTVRGYLDIGIIDTMKDLIVNFIGASVFSSIGYFYLKRKGKGKFAKHFIPVVLKKQPQSGDDME